LLLKIRGEGEIGDRVRFDDLEDPMGVNELLGYTGATVTLGEVYKCKNNLGWRKTDGTVFPLSFVVISS
jgi:hypothetical protein